MLNEDQWNAWKGLPETKALFQVMQLRKERWKERWAAGEFTDLNDYGTTILNAKGIGNCEALDSLITISFHTVTTEIEDAEQDRIEAARESGVSGANRSE